MRWLRPLAPLVLAVVVWSALHSRPGPGASGRELAVSCALGGVVVGGVGCLVTLRGSGRGRARLPGRDHVPGWDHVLSWARVPDWAHAACVGVLMAASAALVWLQPDGVAVAGVFVGLSLLAPRLRGHLSVPLTVGAVVLLATVVAVAQRGSLTTALLNAVMIGAFYGAMFLAMRLAEANRLAERLLAELEQSRAAEAEAAGLAERQHLAREMHDVLAHSLSGLMLQLEGARMLAAADPADPRIPEVIDRAHRLGRSGLAEARRAIGTLRDDELPGPERLPALVERFERDRGTRCRLTVTGEPHELGTESRLALYRVAQEALTNVAKHAHADRVELSLSYERPGARLTIEDFSGEGAGPRDEGEGARDEGEDEVEEEGGYGLTGMRERAELLGGTLVTGPTPTGFRVDLEVPA
ncbi:sensor histidine kinase [Streptomyces sp. NPDC048172]|uniref:sensor histidine kinase n=1 Tax=Streptomyces sp. NPDC048172 TaxID=3365505 RepID=UPI00371C680D